MKYKVFYCFYSTGQEVPGDAPVEMDASDILSDLLSETVDDGDFFGLIDGQGNTLQVMYYQDEDIYWAEIPRQDLGGSYGMEMSFDEIADLLQNLSEMFIPEEFPDFRFESWS